MVVGVALKPEHQPVQELVLGSIPGADIFNWLRFFIFSVDQTIVFNVLYSLHYEQSEVRQGWKKYCFTQPTFLPQSQEYQDQVVEQSRNYVKGEYLFAILIVEFVAGKKCVEIKGVESFIFGGCDRVVRCAHLLMVKVEVLCWIDCELETEQVEIWEKFTNRLSPVKELMRSVDRSGQSEANTEKH